MGHSRERVGVTGLPRYIAYYDDARGRRRSAGTFSSRKEADRAWQRAEAEQLTGRPGDPRAGRIRFADYVNVHWFPHHALEASTRESYRYNLARHILPWFGSMRMGDILPIHVREWVTDLIGQGVTPATIRHQKIILSAIFTTALNDFVINLHPCRGVKTPAVPVKEYQILSPDEITRLLAALPGDTARLLVEVAIESGLRWGELAELRPADLNISNGVLTVSRAVVELNPTDHPDGGRFLVKPYPKSRRTRRFRLDPTLIRALKQHITTRALDGDDLLFHHSMLTVGPKAGAARPVLVDADQLGHTEPTADGRTYRHGTLSAYTAGRCRCPHCRADFAAYRARRRETGLDAPRGPRAVIDTDGHLPRNW